MSHRFNMGFQGNMSLGSWFLYRFLLPATIFALLLFLGSMWLPEWNSQKCQSSWGPCLVVYNPKLKVRPPALHSDMDNVHRDSLLLTECPGQRFQVSRLLSHLHSALGPGSDILLQPYLSSWDELIKFMESLGTVVEFFSKKVKSKVSLIHKLAQQDKDVASMDDTGHLEKHVQHLDRAGEDGGESYKSIRSMIGVELRRGLVNFQRQTDSGCRTLLRLHRSLLWLQLFLKKMAEGPDTEGQLRSPAELCRESYEVALAPHHPWLIRRMAEIAFLAMPEWETFFGLVCVQSQAEAGPVLDRVVRAIEEVHSRTQQALQENGMLELP